MQHERKLIDAIKCGDEKLLSELLRASDRNEEPFRETITDSKPTNHAIGCGMTLLQFASIRSWNGGNPATVLLDHGAEIDLHSACGLGMTDRIAQILEIDPEKLHDQIDTYFPMQFAITAARPAVLECLIEHGDDPNRDLRKVAYFGWEDDIRDQP